MKRRRGRQADVRIYIKKYEQIESAARERGAKLNKTVKGVKSVCVRARQRDEGVVRVRDSLIT